MTAQHWHYRKGNARYGPATVAEIRQMAANGKLLPTDLLRGVGMTEWIPASKVKGLFPKSGQKSTRTGQSVDEAETVNHASVTTAKHFSHAIPLPACLPGQNAVPTTSDVFDEPVDTIGPDSPDDLAALEQQGRTFPQSRPELPTGQATFDQSSLRRVVRRQRLMLCSYFGYYFVILLAGGIVIWSLLDNMPVMTERLAAMMAENNTDMPTLRELFGVFMSFPSLRLGYHMMFIMYPMTILCMVSMYLLARSLRYSVPVSVLFGFLFNGIGFILIVVLSSQARKQRQAAESLGVGPKSIR